MTGRPACSQSYLRENLAGDPDVLRLALHSDHPQSRLPGKLSRPPRWPTWDWTGRCFISEGLEFFGRLSFLKAGIVWADAVTTVSPTYAREIQTPEFGFGMDGLLRSRASKLSGILNGVDYAEWSPETDPHLAAHYSARDLSGKREAKLALLEEMGLPREPDRPLLGIVSRFAHQKGMDLVAEIAPVLLAENAAVAALGSGDKCAGVGISDSGAVAAGPVCRADRL